MSQEKFLLVNLKEDQSRKLAQVLANDSCRKILDSLAEADATESELSMKLGIPLSTVEYNLQQLLNSGLVKAEHFHYSPKGKEVKHYKLANKYIIIAPKPTFGIKEKLRAILPVFFMILLVGAFMQFYGNMFSSASSQLEPSALMQQKMIASDASGRVAVPEAASIKEGDTLASTAYNSEATAKMATISAENDSSYESNETAIAPITQEIEPISEIRAPQPMARPQPKYGLWFMLGGLLTLMLVLFAEYVIYVVKSSRN